MNIGAEVFWPQRQASGLDGTGIIFGIIWDTETHPEWQFPGNGVVVEFMYQGHSGPALVRFYVSNIAMGAAWNGDKFVIHTSDVAFLEIRDRTHKTIEPHVGLFAYCARNGRRVPVWTSYDWSDE